MLSCATSADARRHDGRFWRSAYLSQLFSLRNRILVGTDWLKCKVLGRSVHAQRPSDVDLDPGTDMACVVQ